MITISTLVMIQSLRCCPAFARILSRIISLALLSVLLQGCSMVKLAYNGAPELAWWWLDGYVDFDAAQSATVREELTRLHEWHRSNELPRLAQVLAQAEKLAGGTMNADQACTLVDALRTRLQASLEQAEPAMAALALRLTPAQLRHMEAKYIRNDVDYRKEWVSLAPSEQRDKFAKRLLEQAETVYGKLEDAQKEAIRRQLAASAWDSRTSLRERVRRQQDLLGVLRGLHAERASPAEARLRLHGYLGRTLESPVPEIREWQRLMVRETCQGMAEVQASTTAEQRATAVRRLRAWQRDLAELAVPVVSGAGAAALR
jgi:hypothetical protein